MSYTLSRRSQRKRPVKLDVAPEGLKEDDESLGRLMKDKNWEAAIRLLDTREGRREAGRLLDKGTRELPLHVAAGMSDVNMEFLKKLVEAYPNGARRRDDCGRTPLMVALVALEGSAEEAENEPSVERVGDILECFLTASQEAGPILFLTTGYPSIVRRILRLCPDAAQSRQKFTADLPLHVVCKTDEFLSEQHRDRVVETGKLLYEAYPEAVDMENDQGVRPLAIAAAGFFQMASYLVSVHPAAAAAPTSDGFHRLPIHTICQLPGPPMELVQDLIKAYPEGLVMKESAEGLLPLHCAIGHAHYHWNSEVILALLKANPRAAGIPTNDGSYALHRLCLATESVDLELLRAVVDDFPCALHLPNSFGRLPCHNALLRYSFWNANPPRRVEALALILPLYPTALLTPDNEGKLPFDYEGALELYPYLQNYIVSQGITIPEDEEKEDEEEPTGSDDDDEEPTGSDDDDEEPTGSDDDDNDSNNSNSDGVEQGDNGDNNNFGEEDARELGERQMEKVKISFVKRLIALAYPSLDGLGKAGCDGRVPIHIACANNAPLPVLQAFQVMYPEALQVPEEHTGNLALHLVCAVPPPPYSQKGGDDASDDSENDNDDDDDSEDNEANNRDLDNRKRLERVKCVLRWNGAALLERNHKGELPLTVAFLHDASVDVLYELLRENPEVVISDLLPNAQQMTTTTTTPSPVDSKPEATTETTTASTMKSAKEEATETTTMTAETATTEETAATEAEVEMPVSNETRTVSDETRTVSDETRTVSDETRTVSDETRTVTATAEPARQDGESPNLLWGSKDEDGSKPCFVF